MLLRVFLLMTLVNYSLLLLLGCSSERPVMARPDTTSNGDAMSSADTDSADADTVLSDELAEGTEGVLQQDEDVYDKPGDEYCDAQGLCRSVLQFGSAQSDNVSGIAVADNAVYVTGITNGLLPGNTKLTASGDIYVARIDFENNIEWIKQFGTSRMDTINGMSADTEGFVYIAGFTTGSFEKEEKNDVANFYLAKVSNKGAVAWTKEMARVHPSDTVIAVRNGITDKVVMAYIRPNSGGDCVPVNNNYSLKERHYFSTGMFDGEYGLMYGGSNLIYQITGASLPLYGFGWNGSQIPCIESNTVKLMALNQEGGKGVKYAYENKNYNTFIGGSSLYKNGQNTSVILLTNTANSRLVAMEILDDSLKKTIDTVYDFNPYIEPKGVILGEDGSPYLFGSEYGSIKLIKFNSSLQQVWETEIKVNVSAPTSVSLNVFGAVAKDGSLFFAASDLQDVYLIKIWEKTAASSK